jgi:outer membrane autotransporter protein
MTKTIAKAAQKFPQSRSLVRVSQRGVLALMLGTVALPVSGVWAQQVLSGAQTTTQSPTVGNGLPLVVTTTSGFSVDTTGPLGGGGKGIDLYSKGGISFIDTNQAAITGFGSGINAVNIDAAGRNGGGGTDLTITTYGAVIAKDSGGYNPDGDGIFADNQYGGDLTISVASVTGNDKGISASTVATTGALTITATGVVSGINKEGIDAYNGGTNLTIDAYKVLGGITANNKGSGALLITASDDVTNQLGDAIYARNVGTALTISAASVTGYVFGINATNNGSGALSITATGAVSGTFNDGIKADNKGTDLTISAASVSGGYDGIEANNLGSGALSIIATGAVTGTNYDGIQAYGKGTDLTISVASVAGGSTGINADSYGTGEVDITATGAVIGTGGDGIYAYGKGTHLTITATSVSGSGNGIKAKNKGNGALSITTTGTVSAAGDYSDGISAINYGTDLTISVHSVSGGKYEKAVYAFNRGSGKLSITVSGAVVAGADSNAVGIQTNSADGGEVAIHLLSTSSVSGPDSIKDLGGDAVVTIDAGALVTGSIKLEYGNDTLTIASGVNLSGVTFMSGGSDDDKNSKDFTDTLNISSGWSGNLFDWEVINADTSGGDFALNGFSLGDRYLSKAGDGTLTLNGGLTLASESGNKVGSTLSMGVPQSATNPLILAAGNAVIAGNLIVTPGQTLTFGQDYVLIEANSLTGTFDSVSISGGYSTTLTYTNTSVLLRFDPDSLIALGGDTLTPNARAVAAAFDAAVDGGFAATAFANLYAQADTLNAKLGELSGELHSAERRAALADTSVVREAALDRLGYGLRAGADATAATGGGGAFWMRDLASWGTADADGTGSRATTDQAGFLMGADFVQGNVKYGGMFSYTNTNVDLGSLGYSKTNSTGAALYAGYRQDGAGLAFAAGGAFASTTAMGERSISITGLEQTLTSRVEGTSYQIFGEVSNDLAKAGNVQIEPFARLAYASAHSDAFAETGGVAALSGAKQTNDLRMATLGLRGAYVAGNTTLSGSAAWLRSAGDLSAPTTLSMAGADTPYEVNAAALDQDAVELAAQASVHLAPDMTLAGGYSGTIGKNNATHGVRVTLSVAW